MNLEGIPQAIAKIAHSFYSALGDECLRVSALAERVVDKKCGPPALNSRTLLQRMSD
jgi:hypothetical protein